MLLLENSPTLCGSSYSTQPQLFVDSFPMTPPTSPQVFLSLLTSTSVFDLKFSCTDSEPCDISGKYKVLLSMCLNKQVVSVDSEACLRGDQLSNKAHYVSSNEEKKREIIKMSSIMEISSPGVVLPQRFYHLCPGHRDGRQLEEE